MNSDIQDGRTSSGEDWLYSDIVKEHFFNPKNFSTATPVGYNAMGMVGSPACGDMMKVWLKINPATEKIEDFKWQTFGCASAIASTSALSEIVLENGGKTVDEALTITAQDIMVRLGGLPQIKIHCSVLGDQALEAAVNDYFKKTGQEERVKSNK
jgi:NifU-like protein involved in Fe-S cluster formation